MDPLVAELLKDVPWVVVCIFLLWRLVIRESEVLRAYKEGHVTGVSISAVLESLENTVGTLQAATHETRAEISMLRAELIAHMRRDV